MTTKLFTIPQRLKLLKNIIVISLIFSFCLSYKLWLSERFFPTTPIIHLNIGYKIDGLLALLSCLCLAMSLFFKYERLLILISVLINIFLVLLDLSRLQPWFLTYNVILILLLLFNGRVDNPHKNTVIFIYLQLLVISIYICNALYNFNNYFVGDVLQPFLNQYTNVFSERQFYFFIKIGKTIPVFVFLIGIALIFPVARYLAVSLGIIFHLSLIILLFPSATNLNYANWLINFVFIGILIILFFGETKQRYFSLSILLQKPLFYACIFVFFITPITNVFNRNDNVLDINFVQYPENQKLSFEFNSDKNIPLFVKSFLQTNQQQAQLKSKQWCLTELHSSLINHPKVYTALNNYFQN
jgi:hypothetical protein